MRHSLVCSALCSALCLSARGGSDSRVWAIEKVKRHLQTHGMPGAECEGPPPVEGISGH